MNEDVLKKFNIKFLTYLETKYRVYQTTKGWTSQLGKVKFGENATEDDAIAKMESYIIKDCCKSEGEIVE